MGHTTERSKISYEDPETGRVYPMYTHYGNIPYFQDGEPLGMVEDLREEDWLRLKKEGKLDPFPSVEK